MTTRPIYLNDMSLVCPLGSDHGSVLRRLLQGDVSGLVEDTTWLGDRPTFVGCVRELLPDALPEKLRHWDCRNNRLLLKALEPLRSAIEAAIQRYGRGRVGVVLGSSTSGIADAEPALIQWHQQGDVPAHYHYDIQELGTPSRLLASVLGLEGPAFTLSTACTSSAKALASARRLIQAGFCDLVLAGGVDTLCQLTVKGFASLESLSPERCQPFSAHRRGINVGEAAALFLVSAEEAPVALAGVGETSDAYHISAPHPEGRGAIAAMEQALADAAISPGQLDYLNLHGTATLQNDAMESLAVNRVFGGQLPVSSTKALTGHTLGAAGALEAAFCWLLLSDLNQAAALPPNRIDGPVDPQLAPLNLLTMGGTFRRNRENYMMSNSFAFGGNNIALLLRGTS